MNRDILKSKEVDETVATLGRLLEKAADEYEIFLAVDSGLSIETKGDEVDSYKVRKSIGASIRTIKGGRPGFGFTTVLERAALERLVEDTIAGSSEMEADPHLSFPHPKKRAAAVELGDLVDTASGALTDGEKIESAKLAERVARDCDPRVARVRKSSYGETFAASRLVNSNGLDTTDEATYFTASIAVVAEEKGESQIAWEVSMDHLHSVVDPEGVGRKAAERAVALLGAEKTESKRCPVILENTVVMDLLGTLSSSLHGDSVLKGRSMLAGKVGEEIAAPCINIVDDGLMPGGWATSETDGEGVLTRRTPLVTGGVLEGYLYDSYWASRAGAESTGSSARGGFKGPPGIGTSNFYIEKGERSFENLLGDMHDGFFITDLLGVHTINPVTGEFSLGAQGFLVQGGKVTRPVRGIAVSGDLLGLFKKVSAVGSDMRFMGSIGSPSLLLSELDVSAG